MLVGIIADSHDNLHALRYFVQYFDTHEVNHIIHAGDFISPFTIPVLSEFKGNVFGVFGNNDGDKDSLKSKARGTNVDLGDSPRTLDIDGLNFLISHKPEDLPDPIPEQVDVLIHGHTHEPRIENNNDYLLINPGELGGWLSGMSRAIILDLETLNWKEHSVPSP